MNQKDLQGSGGGGGESKNNNKNRKGMQQAKDPWGEKWLDSYAAENHAYELYGSPYATASDWGWLGPRRALAIAGAKSRRDIWIVIDNVRTNDWQNTTKYRKK